MLRNITMIFLAFIVSSTLVCCIGDDDIACGDDIQAKDVSSEDFTIGFEISLDAVPGNSTRAAEYVGSDYGEEIDNVVDVAGENHDFRILFFDTEDNFLFEATRVNSHYTITPIDDDKYANDNNYKDGNSNSVEVTNVKTKRWRISIPLFVLERNGVLDKIKENNFKIAVLANWPRSEENKLTFSDGKDGKVSKLYDITHYWKDNAYKYTDESYKHLTTSDDKMGAYLSWVENAYGSKTTAEEAIRNEERDLPYALLRKKNGGLSVHEYKHIWRVWNFGNRELIYNNDYVVTENPTFGSQWTAYNEKDKNKLRAINEQRGFSNYVAFYDDGGLSFGSYRGGDSKFAMGSDINKNNVYDEASGTIKITQGLSYSDFAGGKDLTRQTNVFYFRAFAAGTLRITTTGAEGDNVYIGIQRRDNSNNNNSSYRTSFSVSSNGTQTHSYSVGVTGTSNDNIPGDPVDIYILSVGGTVHFSQIEYIEDQRLYDTDRQGILPSEEHLIPMYGIQEFVAIGGYEDLTSGQTLNLSEAGSSGYPYRKVHLLRSVAKVELYLPSDWEPTHLYMRSGNRSGRCEPVDVSLPTNILWNGGEYNGRIYGGIETEIKNIQNYGRFYVDPAANKYESNEMYPQYRDRLSWFYGAWSEWKGTDWWDGTDYAFNNGSYPHIFNSRIDRSDYIHFIKQETVDGYTRYLLYVSEKNIDDPNQRGNLNDTPKVPHIEMRFKVMNDDANLDDNDCYRIYFVSTQPNIERYEYDDWEKSGIEKSSPYPIVRNYIYKFRVTGINANGTPQIGFEICSPADRQVPSITFD